MKIFTFLILLLFYSLVNYSQPQIALAQFAVGFSSPVDIANCGDDRLFIVEQDGIIKIHRGADQVSVGSLSGIRSEQRGLRRGQMRGAASAEVGIHGAVGRLELPRGCCQQEHVLQMDH